MLFYFHKILFLITLIFSFSSFAAQWARVTTKKAVIYADLELQAPIGYIIEGKKVRVGDVARNDGRLLPIVINGKVAYIKISDLDISSREKLLDSPVSRITKKDNDNNSARRFALTYNGMATVLDTTEGEETVVLNGGGLRGYLVDTKKRRSWRISFDYLKTTINDYGLELTSLTTEYALNIIQTGAYDFHAYAGLGLIPYAQFSRGSDFKENGYGGGLSAGMEMIFKFSDTIALHVDGNYQYNKLFFPLNKAVQEDLGVSEFEPSLNGLKFSAGISFRYF